eukprot:1292100-Lingulodinium_polyedra.AAC.1
MQLHSGLGNATMHNITSPKWGGGCATGRPLPPEIRHARVHHKRASRATVRNLVSVSVPRPTNNTRCRTIGKVLPGALSRFYAGGPVAILRRGPRRDSPPGAPSRFSV